MKKGVLVILLFLLSIGMTGCHSSIVGRTYWFGSEADLFSMIEALDLMNGDFAVCDLSDYGEAITDGNYAFWALYYLDDSPLELANTVFSLRYLFQVNGEGPVGIGLHAHSIPTDEATMTNLRFVKEIFSFEIMLAPELNSQIPNGNIKDFTTEIDERNNLSHIVPRSYVIYGGSDSDQSLIEVSFLYSETEPGEPSEINSEFETAVLNYILENLELVPF